MGNVLQFVGPSHNSDGKESVNAAQHRRALAGKTNGFGEALAKMLEGWQQYADAHEARYEEHIGNDFVLGDYWAEVGLAIKRLLDGDTGGFDCGSLAHNIVAAIRAKGIETDGYQITDRDK
jgi:hypothetical protein